MSKHMERILPVGSDQWQQVYEEHANKYPVCCVAAICRKFNQLVQKAIPTGDPMCPPEVKWAKRIHRQIGDKVELAHCEEPFDLVSGFPNGYVAPSVAPPSNAFDPPPAKAPPVADPVVPPDMIWLN